ncbi:DUF6318 family protein [Arthrobacter sp. MDT1-48-3]|uniref:DUF6318 family protein n=1 Tax=Arthrobacter agilis TaxID=37921 RepID=UPI001ABF36E9|nr:DUF6318 family protein [Arthrobacter agilis]
MFSVGARSRERGTPALAGAVIAVMLLTGCQGDGDPSANQTTAKASSPAAPTTGAPTPTAPVAPASSAGPAANVPVPVKPALADENSKEGLEAFTKYWFELFSYGYETNDWAPYDEVTDPGCQTCAQTRQVVGDFYSDGGWMTGGNFQVIDFETDFRLNTSGSVQSFVNYQQTDLTYHEKSGIKSLGNSPDASVNVTFSIFENGAWLMLDFGRPEGT